MNYKEHRIYDWLSQVRRDLHMHPETALEETRTTAKIKEILTGLGIPLVEFEQPPTGAVGLVECRPGDKVLAIRADIDALPMEELNQTPYRSQNPGRMHACGHDGHTAILLGVARELMETGLKDELKGTVKLIFQPAEERVSGAAIMVQNGVLQNPKVDRIIAGHMSPELKVGQVGVFKRHSHAATDTFKLNITGKGAHGAKPHLGIDPILAGAHFVTAVHSIVSRSLEPDQQAVVTVGEFSSGTVSNVIPESAFMQGTVRSFDENARQTIIRRMKELAAGLETSFGVSTELVYEDGVPACVNDPQVSQELYDISARLLGAENVFWQKPQTGGEDFALFVNEVPGSIMRFGCGNPEKGMTYSLHSPYFDMDEEALAVGVEIFKQAMREYLN